MTYDEKTHTWNVQINVRACADGSSDGDSTGAVA